MMDYANAPTIFLIDQLEEHVDIPGDASDLWAELRRRALTSTKPLIECAHCSNLMTVSEEAAYQDSRGVWRSAFERNQIVARCDTPECQDYARLKVYDRTVDGGTRLVVV